MTTTDWIPVDTFGSRLYDARRQLGLSVEEAAKRTGIAVATWSTWERGAKPRNMGAAVAKIALGLGCNRDWLMWGGPRPTESDDSAPPTRRYVGRRVPGIGTNRAA